LDPGRKLESAGRDAAGVLTRPNVRDASPIGEQKRRQRPGHEHSKHDDERGAMLTCCQERELAIVPEHGDDWSVEKEQMRKRTFREHAQTKKNCRKQP
jgi:hypothetical protein